MEDTEASGLEVGERVCVCERERVSVCVRVSE